ncbi:MAG TPA: hypothetical protein VF591_05715 [Pyrinomonadaceae bacterium]|jgi:probable HAF family extracellular repeat protein
MSMRRPRRVHAFNLLLAALFAAGCAAPRAFAQSPPRYTVTDLGPFTPRGVNEMGQAAGSAIIDSRQYAVLYDGTLKTINPPGSYAAAAWGVNNRGQVVGWASFCDVVDGNCVNSWTRAFLYDAGKFTVLGTLGGRDSFGGDINDAGLAVGYSATAGPAPNISGETQAFASGGGALENIGAKLGVGGSLAFGVNSVGQVAGHFGDRNGSGGFLYDSRDGTFSLFKLNGFPDDVNDLGQIVGGLSGNDDGSGRAFLYEGGAVKDLGTLRASHTFSRAWAVNNSGQIVGLSSHSFFTRQDERAFLYEGGAMLDLNALIPAGSGWVLSEAADINGRGQVVGSGRLGGQPRAFLLTPTEPLVLLTEPGSAAALALDSVTFERGPFTLSSAHNLSADGRRRVTLLARNVEFAPGEDVQQLLVRAEGPAGETHLLPVEHAGRVPGFPSLTQITVRLADGLAAGGDFQLSLVLRGTASNKATLSVSAPPAP